MEGASEVGSRKWRCSREDPARLGCRDVEMVQRDASAAVEDQRGGVGEMGIQRWRSGEMRSRYGGLREGASDVVYLGDGVQEWNRCCRFESAESAELHSGGVDDHTEELRSRGA